MEVPLNGCRLWSTVLRSSEQPLCNSWLHFTYYRGRGWLDGDCWRCVGTDLIGLLVLWSLGGVGFTASNIDDTAFLICWRFHITILQSLESCLEAIHWLICTHSETTLSSWWSKTSCSLASASLSSMPSTTERWWTLKSEFGNSSFFDISLATLAIDGSPGIYSLYIRRLSIHRLAICLHTKH